jgi:hypothetical protein
MDENTRALIEFFVYFKHRNIPINNAEELFQVADNYNVENLVTKCTDILGKKPHHLHNFSNSHHKPQKEYPCVDD